jgi:hypothetical protein
MVMKPKIRKSVVTYPARCPRRRKRKPWGDVAEDPTEKF